MNLHEVKIKKKRYVNSNVECDLMLYSVTLIKFSDTLNWQVHKSSDCHRKLIQSSLPWRIRISLLSKISCTLQEF
jgi:hypothetical protein